MCHSCRAQGAGELALAVQSLVQVEARAAAAGVALSAAEGLLASQPEELLQRIVRHFQKLFDCAQLEAVLPVMNKVRSPLTRPPFPPDPLHQAWTRAHSMHCTL